MTALDDLAALVVSEVDALIEDAGDRREPGTVRVLETLRAAVRYLERRPVVESLDDAVRVVEDIFEAHYAPCAGCAALWDGVAIGPAVVEALVADPVLTQHDDGTVTISWPNDTAIAALVSRNVIEGVVAEVASLRRTFVTIRNVLLDAGDDAEPCVHPGCGVPRGEHGDRVRMHTWRGAP